MNRVARSLTTILAILGLALLMPVSSVAAAGCSLTVSPKTGAPGTGFVFRGKGFTPTTMTVTLIGGAGTTKTVNVADPTATSFEVNLLAGEKDVGKWRAVAAGCADVANIRVTLPPTATETTTTPPPPQEDDTTQLASLTLLGVLFLGATALFLPRLTRAARAG